MLHQTFLNQASLIAKSVDPHLTKSNPRVGCIFVQNQKIIGQGAHQHFGGPHAEVLARQSIEQGPTSSVLSAIDLKETTVYLTLEPCVNWVGKKTPACTDLLVKLKPKKVVLGSLDPHFPGQGVAQLKASGIEVLVFNTEQHQQLNPWFETWITQHKPHITLKIAQSLDGKITPAKEDYQTGARKLTGSQTQGKVHTLRANVQAILTTTETVLQDNPRFDVRHAEPLLHPVSSPDLIVLGKRKISSEALIFKTHNRKVYFISELKDLIPFCQSQGIASIMTECGGHLNTALLENDLVNIIEIFTAPIFCGNTAKPSFLKSLNLEKFKLVKTNTSGDDFQLSYRKKFGCNFKLRPII